MRHNILLLMVDQLRPDYVGFSGKGRIETPNIDRIAQGVSFSACQTVNPICTPARTALITGKYTHQIGTLAMSGDLSQEHPTFMQALQKSGYYTSAIGKLHFLQTWEWNSPRGKVLDLVGLKDEIKKYGYDYIWEAAGKQLVLRDYCDYSRHLEEKGMLQDYLDFVVSAGPNWFTPDGRPEDDGEPFPLPEEDYPDIIIADKIVEQINVCSQMDRPFFIFGSFLSPHKPFDPPQRYLDMIDYEEIDDFISGDRELSLEDKKLLYKKRRAYKGMIRLLDDQIGRILDLLAEKQMLDDTIIMFTSDHGEMLGDHYRIQKLVPWEASATVPTAIRHPKYLHAQTNATPVENIDLAATILDCAGLCPQEALSKSWPAFHTIVPARSLMPIVRGESERIRDFAFSECNGVWQMIRSEKWKYIRYLDYEDPDKPEEVLYDLCLDPDETVNRIHDPDYSEAVQWCRNRRNYVLDKTPPAQTRWAPLKLLQNEN